MIINFSEEMAKINDVLPKILDIKSEVTNTADTVRQLRGDVVDLRAKFTSAVAGIQEAADDIMEEDVGIINEIRSFRKSISNGDFIQDSDKPMAFEEGWNDQMTYAGATSLTPKQDSSKDDNRHLLTIATTNEVTDKSTGTISKKRDGIAKKHSSTKRKEKMMEAEPASLPGVFADTPIEENSMQDLEGWTLVNRNKNRKAPNLRPGFLGQGSRKKDSYRVLGVNKDGRLPLKAVQKTADVFVGRVTKDIGESDIKQYIKEVFDIVVKKIEILKIKTDEYNAFKVTVNLSDRDTLFKPDLWPEGLVINKFYKRGS